MNPESVETQRVVLRVICRRGVSIFANHNFKLKIIVFISKLTVIFQALSCDAHLQACELQKVATCVSCETIRDFYIVTPEMGYIKLTVRSYRKIQVTMNIDKVGNLLHSL